MNRTPIALAAALGLALASTGSAQNAPAEQRNAAVDYWQAALLLNASHNGQGLKNGLTVDAAISAVDWEQVGDTLEPAELPQPFHDAADRITDEAMAAFIHAASAPTADFQIRYEDGPKALLTHLGELRRLARAARIMSRANLIRGDADLAADLLVASYRTARHLAGDRTLISSLVAAAIATSAGQETVVLADSGRLTPAGRERLLAAIDELQNDDLFGFRAAVNGERVLVGDWIRREFTGPDAGAEFAREYTAMLGGQAEFPAAARAVSKMDEAALNKEIDRLDTYYDRAVAALGAPDPQAEFTKLDDAVAAGEYGPLAQLIAPSFSKAQASFARAASRLAATADKLRDAQNPAPAGRGQD